MKLIPMTDFVLEQGMNPLQNDENACMVTHRYAEFLQQPLELWMFVPCDEDGNVLEEPIEDNYNLGDIYAGYYRRDLYKYQQAKERVLFEGFEIVRSGKTININNNIFYVVSNGENEVTFHIGLYIFSKGVDFTKTIEDLTYIKPSLSKTAINQIYE